MLSSASDYFSAMFTSDVLEATQNEVNMKDVDPDAMTALVKYMYDGGLEIRMSLYVTVIVYCAVRAANLACIYWKWVLFIS